MKYKMVALDLDGTTLDQGGVLNFDTRAVLNRLARSNIEVVVCTGRIFGSARYFSKLIESNGWIVSSNGALVANYDLSDIIIDNHMDRKTIKSVFQILESAGVYYHFYDHINYYTKELTYRAKMYKDWNDSLPKEDRININIIDNPFDIIDKSELNVYKVVVHDKDCNLIAELKSKMSDLGLEVVSSIRESFDIMKKGSTKGMALKHIADRMDISRDEIIAFGDNENDISMIEYAGLGVAVKNAEQCLKDKADLIIESNNNHGVANFLDNLFS